MCVSLLCIDRIFMDQFPQFSKGIRSFGPDKSMLSLVFTSSRPLKANLLRFLFIFFIFLFVAPARSSLHFACRCLNKGQLQDRMWRKDFRLLVSGCRPPLKHRQARGCVSFLIRFTHWTIRGPTSLYDPYFYSVKGE